MHAIRVMLTLYGNQIINIYKKRCKNYTLRKAVFNNGALQSQQNFTEKSLRFIFTFATLNVFKVYFNEKLKAAEFTINTTLSGQLRPKKLVWPYKAY